ncbi:aquaporin-like protein [Kockovaella imperatae]|uniref:Aquaporin-like protein n=1 Tax=Kockovaella imperatae TaxID=4999 RepID=A0A1Y1UD59_9TREE|nr:aquaporin-like protein [Kockovaella imperatae]ORX35963.1 aquaporin-like protein [Kockovaella imperatae]
MQLNGSKAPGNFSEKDQGKKKPFAKLRAAWGDNNLSPRMLKFKNHFIAMVGEYVGTVLFMIFALGGTNVANMPSTNVTGQTTSGQNGSEATAANTSNLLYIALSFGFSLAVNAWIFFRVSGGLFNPAVSLGMALVGALTPFRAALLTFAQILGGITGSAIIQALTPGTLNVRTQLADSVSVARGLFIEMFLTSLLMIAILLLAAEKHKATFIAPIGIGLALFVAELFGVYYTGGSLNPARSFGPSVVLRDFDSYSWIYWLGPALGATIAAGFYKMLKVLQYETVLGPEDGDNNEEVAGFQDTSVETGDENESNDARSAEEGRSRVMSSDTDRTLAHNSLDGKLSPHSSNDSTTNNKKGPNEPRRMEERLDRIEELLARLVESRPSPNSTPQGGRRVA